MDEIGSGLIEQSASIARCGWKDHTEIARPTGERVRHKEPGYFSNNLSDIALHATRTCIVYLAAFLAATERSGGLNECNFVLDTIHRSALSLPPVVLSLCTIKRRC